MGKGDRVLVIIPARAGSKRLPRKNVLPLGGKPLIAWTIEAALNSGVANMIVVSSDDDDILDIASEYNGILPMRRRPELATDTTSTIEVVHDVIEYQKSVGNTYQTVILLQPTSPLRGWDDTAKAYELYRRGGGKSVISVCAMEHPIEWCGRISGDGLLDGFVGLHGKRSQDFLKHYRLNGAIYIASTNTINMNNSFFSIQTLAYVMEREKSIDIDTLLDLYICEAVLKSESIYSE